MNLKLEFKLNTEDPAPPQEPKAKTLHRLEKLISIITEIRLDSLESPAVNRPNCNMRLYSFTAAFALLLAEASALDKPLNIEVTHPIECSKKTKTGRLFLYQEHSLKLTWRAGDKVEVHYRGTLEADGKNLLLQLSFNTLRLTC